MVRAQVSWVKTYRSSLLYFQLFHKSKTILKQKRIKISENAVKNAEVVQFPWKFKQSLTMSILVVEELNRQDNIFWCMALTMPEMAWASLRHNYFIYVVKMNYRSSISLITIFQQLYFWQGVDQVLHLASVKYRTICRQVPYSFKHTF